MVTGSLNITIHAMSRGRSFPVARLEGELIRTDLSVDVGGVKPSGRRMTLHQARGRRGRCPLREFRLRY